MILLLQSVGSNYTECIHKMSQGEDWRWQTAAAAAAAATIVLAAAAAAVEVVMELVVVVVCSLAEARTMDNVCCCCCWWCREPAWTDDSVVVTVEWRIISSIISLRSTDRPICVFVHYADHNTNRVDGFDNLGDDASLRITKSARKKEVTYDDGLQWTVIDSYAISNRWR